MEETEEKSIRELTMKDFEGVEVNPNGFQIEILAAVAEHALALLDQEERMKMKDKHKKNDSEHLEKHNGTKKKKTEKEGPKFSDNLELVDEHEQSRKKLIKSEEEEAERKGEKIQPKFSERLDIKKSSLLIRRDKEAKYRAEIENGDDRKSKKLKNKRKEGGHDRHGPQPPPPLPMEFRKALEELAQGKPIEEPNLVIQKSLYYSDILKNQNRLSLPSNDLLCDFLKEHEVKALELHEGKNVVKMQADIIEPSLQRGIVSFRRWEMSKGLGKSPSISYVLTGTWNNIVRKNSLVEHDIVQVWSARVDGKLCFLLVRVPSEGEGEGLLTCSPASK